MFDSRSLLKFSNVLGYALVTGHILSKAEDYIAAGMPNYYDELQGHVGQVLAI